MRILICSIEMPDPPVNGFKLQLTALLREFRREHDVRLIGFVDRAESESAGPHGERREGDRAFVRPSTGLMGKLRDLPVAMATRQPLGVQRLAARMRRPLAQELARYQPDVVHVSTTELGLLGPDLRRAEVPSVMVADDAWHLNAHARAGAASGAYRRLLRWQESWVRRFESAQLRDFGAVVVVSEGDADALHGLDPSLSIHAIPNGVDAERFSPGDRWEPEPGLITFTGVMSYPPNVTAAEFLARRVLPRVRASRADARLAIVGRRPSPAVRALSSLDRVEVVGEVPDLVPWLRRSNAYACPMLSGTGIKNKLLEAMAVGLPCVATPLATRGMEVESGTQLLVGETEEELAAALVRVLEDDPQARALGRAARGHVVERHGWDAVAARYLAVYREVIAGAPAAT